MKNYFLLLAIFVSCLFLKANTKEPYVYICTGETAYAYHSNKNCHGLNRCQCEIKYVTLSKAFEMEREKPCGYCYKK